MIVCLPFPPRYTPTGLLANMSVSVPFTSRKTPPLHEIIPSPVSLDQLGLTDKKNPWGLASFLQPFLGLLGAGR